MTSTIKSLARSGVINCSDYGDIAPDAVIEITLPYATTTVATVQYYTQPKCLQVLIRSVSDSTIVRIQNTSTATLFGYGLYLHYIQIP